MTVDTKVKVQLGQSTKSAAEKGLKLHESDEQVQLVDASPTPTRGWRPSDGKTKVPLSLTIHVKPRVLEVFTSAKGSSEPKNVFFVGESIQWNIIHRVDPFIKKVPFNRTVFLQRIGLGSFADDKQHAESVFPIETSRSTNTTYQFQATWSRWWLDAIPVFSGAIGPALPSQIVDGIARGQFGLIAHPGIWKMTGIVTIRSNVERDFSLLDGWSYEIVGTKRGG